MTRTQSNNRKRKKEPVTFETVRRLALALPGVTEGTTHRTTAFRVNGKLLARFHQDSDSVVVRVEFAAREVLMGINPVTFYVTDNYRCWPYVMVRLSSVDTSELRNLLEEAWRSRASKRAVLDWNAQRKG